MASIFKPRWIDPATGNRKPARRWRIAYIEADGRRKVVAGFTDRAATMAKAAQLERNVERRKAGLVDASTDGVRKLVSDAIAEYVAELRRLGRSEPYIENTNRFVNRITVAAHWKTLGNINADGLRTFLQSIATKSNKTQNHYRQAYVGFAQWCVRQGWLPVNPLLNVPRLQVRRIDRKRPRRPFSEPELRQLLETVPSERRTIYLTAALTGFRRKDLARLLCGDLVTTAVSPIWKLREEAVKERRDATLPMAPELVKPLRQQIAGRAANQPLFPTIPTLRTLKADMKKAGIERIDKDRRQVDWHSFRYFFAVLCAKTMPLLKVKTPMRHADVRQTANLYAELGLSDVGEDVWTLPALFTCK